MTATRNPSLSSIFALSKSSPCTYGMENTQRQTLANTRMLGNISGIKISFRHNLHRRFVSLMGATALAAATFVGLTTSPASAATNFTLSYNPPGEGTVAVQATLTWSAKSVSWTLKVIDGCGASGSGDGLGAAARLDDNTSSFMTFGAWKTNNNGCGTTSTFSGTTTRSTNIVNVIGNLAYTKDGVNHLVKQACYDNPNVSGNGCA